VKITLKKRTSNRVKIKLKRKARIRKKLSGTSERPRLTIFRSGKHTYAQLIDDVTHNTLASASTVEKSFSGKGKSNKEAATIIGKLIAERAKEKNIKDVVFDRSGYLYHGRVSSVASSAREAGLNF